MELNDIGHFRTEVEVEANYMNNEFIMEVELMFTDLMNMSGQEINADFKCVSLMKYKISKKCYGIYEYLPVVFDEQHYCAAACTVHSVLIDFRFRTRPLIAGPKKTQEKTPHEDKAPQTAPIKPRTGV